MNRIIIWIGRDKFLRFMYFAVMIMALLVGIAVANADDVYNFYFQKSPGPTTVIQQGGSATPAVVKDGTVVQQGMPTASSVTPASSNTISTTPSSTSTASVSASTATNQESKESNNILSFGYAESGGAALTKGFNISYERKFFKYLGVFASLLYTDPVKYVDQYYGTVEFGGLGGALGVSLTPIQVRLFDHGLLELGAVGGAMYTSGIMNDDYSGFHNGVVPFWGPRLTVNFTDSLGIAAEVRWDSKSDFQNTVNLLVRL